MREIKSLKLNISETETLFKARVLLGRLDMFTIDNGYSEEIRYQISKANEYVDNVLHLFGADIELNAKDVKFEED